MRITQGNASNGRAGAGHRAERSDGYGPNELAHFSDEPTEARRGRNLALGSMLVKPSGERQREPQFPHLTHCRGRPAGAPPLLMSRPVQVPPRPAARPESPPSLATANPRRPAAAAFSLARGPPAPGAGSLLAHFAAAAAAAAPPAAPPSPDSVRPDRSRAPRGGRGALPAGGGGLQGGERAGTAVARTQAEGGAAFGAGARRGTPSISLGQRGRYRTRHPSGAGTPQPPQWIGLGVFPGVCLHAGRFHAAAGGMMLNPPDLARRHGPGPAGHQRPPSPHLRPLPRRGSGGPPEGRRPAGRSSAGDRDGGMLGFPDVGRASPAWSHLGRGFLHRHPNPPYGVD